ncbi:MAG TPA: type III pantothenate kinase [Gammaproteobacteria bacterium]|nr:type III pantothenate kinase [Gammaproteobacteria bacterium]
MILLIDAGNSSLKWGLLNGDTLEPGGRMIHERQDVREVAAQAWGQLPVPERAVIANVGGDRLAGSLRAWMKRTWRLLPEFPVAGASAAGVTNAYRQPERLGVDRWAALVAARHHAGGPACVVDCGTAITIDVLGADGAHLGGLITPGLRLMRRSLSAGTRGIGEDGEPPLMQDGQVCLLGRDTQGAVSGGTLYAAVALIDRVLADMREEAGDRISALLTGGDAPTVLPLLAGPIHHRPDLVLEGLAILARETSCAS